MSNRLSRLVVPIYSASSDGRYWGRYPLGNKPITGADLAANAQDLSSVSAAVSTAIRLGGAAHDAASASAGISTSIKLAASAGDIVTASGSFAGVFDYYISPTGSDSNPGTQSQPWAITALNTKRATYAGKRVGLLDGTYYVATLASSISNPDQLCLQIASGTNGSPTVIQAVNARQAVIDGTDGSGNRVNAYYSSGCGVIGQTYLNDDTGNVVLRDLVIRKGYRYLVHFRYNAGIADGPRYSGVLVENCEIYDINNTGAAAGDNISCVQAYTTDGMTIRNCKIYTARGESPTAANGYGILTWSCNNSILEFNYIHDVKDGIYVKNDYQTGATIRYNFIDLSDYTGGGTTNCLLGLGFSTAGQPHAHVYGNVLKGTNGWRVVGDLGTILQGPCEFYNNTVVAQSTTFGTCGVEMLDSSYAQQFYNNIVYHSGASSAEEGDVCFATSNPGPVDFNCYAPSPKFGSAASGGTFPSQGYSTLSAWRAAISFDLNSLATNPTFTGSGSGAAVYQLQSGSPCAGAGRVGGVSGGSPVDQGAWGIATQVGCNF